MYKILAVIITLMSFSSKIWAISGPEWIEITPKYFDELGFKYELIVQSSDGVGLNIIFPTTIKKHLKIRRVQTTLFNSNKDQIAGTSSDYLPGQETAKILIHYETDKYDMSVTVQYFSDECTGTGCSAAYNIKSINDFLITSQGTGR